MEDIVLKNFKAKKLILSVLVFIIIFANTVVAQESPQKNLKNIFNLGNYSIYSDEIIDTYIIASILYFDFESDVLMPNLENHQLYIDTKNYFEKYNENEFIKNLGKYVDLDNRDIDSNVILNLILEDILSVENIGTNGYIPNFAFQDANEFEKFKTALYDFYYDTKAHTFFEEHRQYYDDLKVYTLANADKIPISNLFETMESYIGNRDVYFKDSSIDYVSFVTVFIPNNARFFRFGLNDRENKSRNYFVALQSPNPYSPTNLMKFDFNKIIEDIIHESLHNYMNSAIYENSSLIEQLSQNKNPKDYCSPLYYNFEWNQIVAENIVRVVETSIYKDVYGSEERAVEQILNKEILYFNKDIKSLYNCLKVYENNRDKYNTIDDYMPELIKTLFNN